MTGKDLMNGMNFVDDKYVQQAEFKDYTALEERSLFMKEHNNKKSAWIKWGLAAACLCLVIAGTIGWRSGWFEPKARTVTLSSGEVLAFRESDTSGASSLADIDAETKAIADDEIAAVFGNLPIKDCVKYTSKDGKFMGLQGKYDDMKLVIEMPGEIIMDTNLKTESKGDSTPSSVDGVCFVTDANSKGEKTVIYAVEIFLENCKVYIEGAGKEEEREKTEEAVGVATDKILASSFDFAAFEK